MYDNNGDPFGFICNGTEYYYVKNAQNDVTAIASADGTIIANYYYDSWGKLAEITGDTEIAELNPIRYRSYYYDSETEWYYLNTRYYSPELCRFINGDSMIDNRGAITQNLFHYCSNNPVINFDPSGNLFGAIVVAGLVIAGVALLLSGCTSSSQSSNSSSPSLPSRPPSTSKPSTTNNTTSSSSTKYSRRVYSYAATVYAEAGGQNRQTKRAIAHVINNRVGIRPSWQNIEDVISANGQFDGYNSRMYKAAMNYYENGICENPIEKEAMDESLSVVIPIYNGTEADITGGALYFHSLENPSDWAYHDDYTQVYIDGTEKFWFYK